MWVSRISIYIYIVDRGVITTSSDKTGISYVFKFYYFKKSTRV